MSQQPRPLRRLKMRMLAIGLGSAVALFATLLAVRWTRSASAPRLTTAALEAASQRWRAANVRNYDLDVEIFGRQPGRVHLEVRNGEPTLMTRDGRTPSQRRTWDAWTVESQLAMIRDELAKSANPVGFGAPPDAQVMQRAQFDERYGYPLDYQRTILGTALDIEWRVDHFEPCP